MPNEKKLTNEAELRTAINELTELMDASQKNTAPPGRADGLVYIKSVKENNTKQIAECLATISRCINEWQTPVDSFSLNGPIGNLATSLITLSKGLVTKDIQNTKYNLQELKQSIDRVSDNLKVPFSIFEKIIHIIPLLGSIISMLSNYIRKNQIKDKFAEYKTLLNDMNKSFPEEGRKTEQPVKTNKN